MFSLHPQLAADTIALGTLPLSLVLLMNNSQLPWLILVPKRQDIEEWHHLPPAEQAQLHSESMFVSKALMLTFNGDKLNTGALGNIVSQLHLHHIVRFKSDPVWPKPVWGNVKPKPYNPNELQQIRQRLDTMLEQNEGYSRL